MSQGFRGGPGRWCPNCGTRASPSAVTCVACGLELASRVARDLEGANGSIYALRERRDALEADLAAVSESLEQWTAYRDRIVETIAPAPAPAAHVADAAPWAAVPLPRGFVPEPLGAPAEACVDPPAEHAAPAAPAAVAELQPGSWVAPAAAPIAAAVASQPAPRARPERRLSAAALLGVAGAALVIIAGIVFVAASWATYESWARGLILLVFAATFAAIADLATRRDFATIGGALGVVGAGFVGVAVYAFGSTETRIAPYTTPIALVVASAAGLALAARRIKAVGGAAAGGTVLAGLALSIELAARAPGGTENMARYVIGASLAGAAVFASRPLWRTPAQRGIVAWGGVALAYTGIPFALGLSSRLTERPALAAVAMALSLAAVAAVAWWRPRWASGVLTAFVTALAPLVTFNLAPSGSSAWEFALTGALAAASAALWRAPAAWRRGGVYGLVPGAIATALVAIVASMSATLGVIVRSGGDLFQGWYWGLPELHGGALLVAAGALWLLARGEPHAEMRRAYADFGAGVWAFAVVMTAGGLARYVAPYGGEGGAAMVAGAAVAWAGWRAWGRRMQRPLLIAGLYVAFLGAVPAGLALGGPQEPESAAHLAWAIASAVAVALALIAGSWRYAPSAAGAVLAISWFAPIAAWRVTGDEAWSFATAAGVAVASLAVALAVRGPARRWVAGGSIPAAVAGVAMAISGAVGALATNYVPGSDVWARDPWAAGVPWWGVVSLALLGIGGVVASRLAAPERRAPLAALAATPSLVGLAVMAANAALLAVDPRAPWSGAVLLGALLLALGATRAPLLRAASAPVAWAAVGLTAAHAAIALTRLADAQPRWPLLGALGVMVGIGAGASVRWPRFAAMPTIAVGSLIAPAALWSVNPRFSVAAVVAATVIVAWTARFLAGQWRLWVLGGGSLVMLSAAASFWLPLHAAARAWSDAGAGVHIGWAPWELAALVGLVAALLAWPAAWRHAAWIAVGGLVLAAGLVAWPVGWIALGALGVVGVEAGERWHGRSGLGRGQGVALSLAALTWAVTSSWEFAIALGALAATVLFAAVRAPRGSLAGLGFATAAPLLGGFALGNGIAELGLAHGAAAVWGTGAALTMTLLMLAAKVDPDPALRAPWLLAFISIVGPAATGRLALAGVALLLASVAWFALRMVGGPRWARWVGIGVVTPATVLLLAAARIDVIEAYTAVPAVTLVGFGVWWLHARDTVRTHTALMPGLAMALVPSYIALAVDPGNLMRPVVLAVAALGLAVVGVWRGWFAPLLGTAVTSVAIAISQLVVDNALVPRFVSFAFIGGVLLALGFTAEKIRAMR